MKRGRNNDEKEDERACFGLVIGYNDGRRIERDVASEVLSAKPHIRVVTHTRAHTHTHMTKGTGTRGAKHTR